MLENSNSNGRVAECTECDPPRRFKNKAGLNGHTQFKHGRLPDNRDAMPNGKQSQMYQDLTDRVNQVLGRQDDIIDYLKHGNGNGDGDGLANGTGNGYSDEPIGIASPPPVDPTTYSHQGFGAPLEKMQRHCGGCGQEIEWAGLP
tara:strand:- start:98 stop:532 length:435 start_codon:yes stop_codon:yes gene_type:complete